MEKLRLFFFLPLLVLLLSCDKEADEKPLIEKKARIELDFEGSLDQYMINFGVHSLQKGTNGLVKPLIKHPINTDWTQVIEQGNTYNLSTPLTFNKLEVESEEPVHTLGFIFNVIHTGDRPDENFQDLNATIKVFGNNEEFKSFHYTARPVGEVSMPLSEIVRF